MFDKSFPNTGTARSGVQKNKLTVFACHYVIGTETYASVSGLYNEQGGTNRR